MKVVVAEGVRYLVGQNANENWKLVSEAPKEYGWVHLASFPSGHVIVEKEAPTEEELMVAAKLCLAHSKYKNLRNVKACTTTVGNLVMGDAVGEVEFKSNRRVRDFRIVFD